jgi:hypothetical protein
VETTGQGPAVESVAGSRRQRDRFVQAQSPLAAPHTACEPETARAYPGTERNGHHGAGKPHGSLGDWTLTTATVTVDPDTPGAADRVDGGRPPRSGHRVPSGAAGLVGHR